MSEAVNSNNSFLSFGFIQPFPVHNRLFNFSLANATQFYSGETSRTGGQERPLGQEDRRDLSDRKGLGI